MSANDIVDKFRKHDLCDSVNVHMETDVSFASYDKRRNSKSKYSESDQLGAASEDFRRSLPSHVLEQYAEDLEKNPQQFGLPTPPSSRNNSGASNKSRRSVRRQGDPAVRPINTDPSLLLHNPPSPPHTTNTITKPADWVAYHQHDDDDTIDDTSVLSPSPSVRRKLKMPFVERLRRFRSNCKECRDEKQRQRDQPKIPIADPPEPPPVVMSSMLAGSPSDRIQPPPKEMCRLIKAHQLDSDSESASPVQPTPTPATEAPQPPIATAFLSPGSPTNDKCSSNDSSTNVSRGSSLSYKPNVLRRRNSCPCNSGRRPLSQASSTFTDEIFNSPSPTAPSELSFTSTSTATAVTPSNNNRHSYFFLPSRHGSANELHLLSSSSYSFFSSLTDVSNKVPVNTDVYEDDECLVAFSELKPRTVPLKRKTSDRRERKMLGVWHDSLVETLEKYPSSSIPSTINDDVAIPPKKLEKDLLTRQFILREFYTTEVTFWSQLYYSKVMFMEPLKKSILRNLYNVADLDIFSNLSDLLNYSSRLLCALGPHLLAKSDASCASNDKFTAADKIQRDWQKHNAKDHGASSDSNAPPLLTRSKMVKPSDELLLGKILCDMSNLLVTFLRCALDYKQNRKHLSEASLSKTSLSKRYNLYREKLYQRKETSQFFINDYLIIPIQRITRYGLLLADLQKHTPLCHPDYVYIRRARIIMRSLAVAMNKAQRR
ncbi:Dbl homology domain-containing protein [Hesseltinella vesiculosa]|uniref:Dbl homology domain-containing protein n=1 Tax=Hesseltinella vesiculosa TaxID=101127 RepID=A0A1X2GDL6_9FUNG|nr:Dbl homology domain-containing protein [Hesseltinella vesiculosa]